MEPLQIQGTKSTPEICFEQQSGKLSMCGESYPENSFEFYKPLLSWIARFTAIHDGPVNFDVRMSYLNTGSTKCMMDILDILDESFLAGKEVMVNWYYDRDNERALENAEEFKEEVTMPFNIIPIVEEA